MTPITDDQRLYVIGDIHGRSDLLDRITQKISRDLWIEVGGRVEMLTLRLCARELIGQILFPARAVGIDLTLAVLFATSEAVA